ncbi:cobaltochelatase CobT-related protein [Litchfieldella anticariensis]|nr:hypothetical protein [Halomonas anticariensis]
MSRTSIEPPRVEGLMEAWCRTYGQDRPLTCFPGPIAPFSVRSRKESDAQAAWQRWHDPREDLRFTDIEWSWYAVLERARVETMASEHLPGMARNLGHLKALSPVDPGMARLYLAARRIFDGQADIGTAILVREEEPKRRMLPRPSLKGWRLSWQSAPVTREAMSKPLTDADVIEGLGAARRVLTDGGRFAEVLHPLIQALVDFHGHGSQDNPAPNSAPSDDTMLDADSSSDAEHPDADLERSGGQRQDPVFTKAFPDYIVFTRDWDEEHLATRWYHPDDAAALKALNTLDRQRVRQLAHRLQRRLLAARLRHWTFDQEEGVLDSRRLARLVGTKPSHRVFRLENEAPVPEACVTLLVDQSGSMRGVRRHMAALAIDLAVHTLEVCQVRCEVLGYTTRFSADNPVSQRWRKTGCHGSPGRLNALRHILYKTAEQPWRRARPLLGLLLREGFGHENIDGEALHWAARRLMYRPQMRKVLVVLSDGAPHDEDTVRANGREFLDNHLRAVIAEIESSPIHLVAIGTGQDVGRFYRHAVTVRRPEAVAEVLFERLGDLLTQAQPGRSMI